MTTCEDAANSPLPPVYNLAIYSGDDWTVTIRFEDSDGESIPVPDTGWASQIRASADADAVQADLVIDASEGAEGVLV